MFSIHKICVLSVLLLGIVHGEGNAAVRGLRSATFSKGGGDISKGGYGGAGLTDGRFAAKPLSGGVKGGVGSYSYPSKGGYGGASEGATGGALDTKPLSGIGGHDGLSKRGYGGGSAGAPTGKSLRGKDGGSTGHGLGDKGYGGATPRAGAGVDFGSSSPNGLVGGALGSVSGNAGAYPGTGVGASAGGIAPVQPTASIIADASAPVSVAALPTGSIAHTGSTY